MRCSDDIFCRRTCSRANARLAAAAAVLGAGERPRLLEGDFEVDLEVDFFTELHFLFAACAAEIAAAFRAGVVRFPAEEDMVLAIVRSCGAVLCVRASEREEESQSISESVAASKATIRVNLILAAATISSVVPRVVGARNQGR